VKPHYLQALPAPDGELTWIDHAMIERAIAYSRTSPRGRVIAPFHKSGDDLMHRMLNAVQPHSYIRPHRHHAPPKSEAWVVLRGAVAFFTFDASGAICECARIGPGEPRIGVDLVPGVYHTFVALSPDTVIYEIKNGPYAAHSDKEFAPFAPAEDAPEADTYRRDLLSAYWQRRSSRLSELSWRPPVLTTQRLLLRGFELSDADAVHAYAADEETTRHMAWDRHRSTADTLVFLNGWVADCYANQQLDYAICLRQHPEHVIGALGIYAREQANWDLGYILARAHWGQGLLPEAARGLLSHVFQETTAQRVAARIYADNAKSRRAAEKIGMQLDGVLRAVSQRHGVRKDEAIYSVLRQEWR
jgi:cupin fold WbuC family metalloprotein